MIKITPDPKDNPTYYPDYEPSLIERKEGIAAILIFVGVLLILFAGVIGTELVKERFGSSSYSINPDKAREAILVVRSAGSMCFLAGLIERVIAEIIKLRVAITKEK